MLEHHAPRQGCCCAPQFTVDEVANTAGEQANRNDRRGKIGDVENIDFALPGKDEVRDDDANQTTVERHTAFPDAEDDQRVMQKNQLTLIVKVIEQGVADTAAENDAHDDIKQQVANALRRPVVMGHPRTAQSQPPGAPKSQQIHKPIPAHGQRTQVDGNGINIWMYQHKYFINSL